MRDLLVTLIVFGSLPLILKRPAIGIMMWIWISVMNPHRLSWGFAYNFPFAYIIAVVTILSLFLRQKRQRFPWSSATVLLLLFVLWMNVSTLFALVPSNANTKWLSVMKTMLMVFVALIALNEKKHIEWLVWALALCLAYFGVKGGIFMLSGQSAYLVFGPPNSYIEENNALAMALIMTIPLLWYLRTRAAKPWIRWALLGAMGLCTLSALGSYSRGALVAIVPMAGFLWMKSRNKISLGILLILLAPAALTVMPDKWFDRMSTIAQYQEDGSALGRLNAWQMAFNVAKDRPLVGGGFEIYEPHIFARYAPVPEDLHAAHSIYFTALGEHGFIGLALLLMLGVATWRTASWVVRHSKGISELRWAADLGLMIQVSLVAYAVGGAFLSVLYFDVPYYLMVVLVLLKVHVQKTLAQKPAKVPSRMALQPASSLRFGSGHTRPR